MGVGRNHNKGGCKRLFAFVCVCSRMLAFSPLRLLAFVNVSLNLFAFARILRFCKMRLLAFVNVCLHLLAFAYAPLCQPPPLVPLNNLIQGGTHTHTHSTASAQRNKRRNALRCNIQSNES